MKSNWTAPVILAAAALSACGGGGAGTITAAPVLANPAGVYGGTLTNGSASELLLMIIDENGSGVMVNRDASTVFRFTAARGNTFSASYKAYKVNGNSFPGGGTFRTGTIEGDLIERDSIVGTVTPSGGLDSGYMVDYSTFYEVPAPLSETQGRYLFTFEKVSGGATVTVDFTLTSAGNIVSATDTDGCSYSGTASIPDPLYNAYNLSLTRNCSSVLTSLTGLATYVRASPPDAARFLLEYDDGVGFAVAVSAIKQ